MNFDRKIKSLQADIESKLLSMNNILGQFKIAAQKTEQFLNDCGSAGYTKISIGEKTDSIPCSKSFPFGHTGSVFGFTPDGDKRGTWPAIWGVCEKHKITKGCGNNDQHQADTSNLIDGVYHLKNGIWEKV